MVAHIETVAFQGVDARPVDVQVQIAGGMPAFTIVGLADKAVGESRERVRAALSAIGLGLPPKRITVNLAPADLPKEGSHYDLPIALGLLVAMGVLPPQEMEKFVVIGELSLDGAVNAVAGALPAAMAANARGRGLICPEACGPEAAWAGMDGDNPGGVLAPRSIIQLVNHVKGTQILSEPVPMKAAEEPNAPDLRDIKGQVSAKRALELAAAGGHNMLMVGPPGSGKSMLAARLPGILPHLSPREMLEVSMIASIAGELMIHGMGRRRPYRAPHHSASMPALIGGGLRAKPGEVSLAHRGVLFLDELPEFPRQVLDSLRQPLETGEAVVSRANAHVSYPARFQLVAAMNPCRCGHAGDAARACPRVPRCVADYQAKLSGPLLDRFDINVEVPPVSAADLSLPPPAEGSAEVAARIARARALQADRFESLGVNNVSLNAHAEGELLEKIAAPDDAGRTLLTEAAERMGLTARGYHRVIRVARTLADLEDAQGVTRLHIAEALSYRESVGARLGTAA
ncbi:magnesium chelatase family protein [Parvibaculum indicum]|uniref:YifB family Mg chelatase-like AAA ATPase n=1 Tax=Parvibaculum indicum TaxID=562969 RepID=UPI00141E2495|nr:YifB family Mg chelatase-like AAA ATPase [Parvibaculum indicum]NIJ42208.1 magnesium chelatase family protein [Parvibaculum indicum]